MELIRIFRSRKGVFFTLISVSLLAILLFSYSATYIYTYYERSSVIETRVETMDRFLGEVDRDMENAIYISGFRALIGLEDYVSSTGAFVNSTEYAFGELFLNGTVYGQQSVVMGNNTFPYWVGNIQSLADSMGINFSLELDGVSIYHTSPWVVRVVVNASVNISDQKSTALWTQNKSLFSDISIIGFEDPLYIVYTGNNIVKRINQTFYYGIFTDELTNTTNIRDHVGRTLYANFTGAPSFLMRFENDFNKSVYGIESFVDKAEVSPYYSCPTETSSIDSIYWLCDTSVGVYQVANWSGFRIDNETDIYNSTTRIGLYMLEGYVI